MNKMSEAFAEDFHVNNMAIAMMIYPIQAIDNLKFFLSINKSYKRLRYLMIKDGCCLML